LYRFLRAKCPSCHPSIHVKHAAENCGNVCSDNIITIYYAAESLEWATQVARNMLLNASAAQKYEVSNKQLSLTRFLFDSSLTFF